MAARAFADNEELGVLAGERTERGAGCDDRTALGRGQDLDGHTDGSEHGREHALDPWSTGEENDDGRANLANAPSEGESERARQTTPRDLTDREHFPSIKGRELDPTSGGAKQKNAGVASNRMAFKHNGRGVR